MTDTAFWFSILIAFILFVGAVIAKPYPVFFRFQKYFRDYEPEKAFLERRFEQTTRQLEKEADQHLASVPKFIEALRYAAEISARSEAKSKAFYSKKNPAGLVNRQERRKMKLKLKA